MSKIKITGSQFAITTSGFVFGSAPLLISSSVAVYAGQDAWLSAIFSTIIGLSIIWINTSLGGLYPDKTFIEVICLLLGKWLGKTVSITFIFVTFVTAIQVTWYVGDFITTTYLPEISTYPINILFLAVLAIAMIYGLEAMCRACTVFFILIFPIYVLSLAMLIPNMHVTNLLPVFEKGISPVLKGIIPLLSFTTFPTIVLNMVYPSNIENLKKAKKSMFYGYLLGMIIASIGILMCILVLGSNFTANSRFPLFILTQEINVGTIFSRLEAVVIAVWLTTNFISTFFYFYAGTLGLSQLLKLNDYKKLVLPLVLIMAVFSRFIYKNVPYEISWDTYVWAPVAFTAGFVLPVVLLLIYGVKKWLGKRKVVSE